MPRGNVSKELRFLFLKEILGDNKEVKEKFISNFENEISAFVDSIVESYKAWKEYDYLVGSDRRRAFVAAFLFNALSSLLVSMKMFIFGYAIPSGNLVRQTIESICSAVLCSREKVQFYQQVERDKFSSRSSINLVLRHSASLRIEREAMISLKKLYEFYHKLSHSSSLTLAFNISIGNLGRTYIGSSFDEDKMFAYEKEIVNRVHLSKNIMNLIEGLLLEPSEAS
jgi:hypothetical protein